MSKMSSQAISRLQGKVLRQASLTAGKRFSVQDASVAAGRSGEKFVIWLLLQEMKGQHKR